MWTCVGRMGSGLVTSLSPRVHIIHVTALQRHFVLVWVWYINICTVTHPVRLFIVLDEISICQALCTVPTKSAVYYANQALCTVPTKHCVLCQPSAVYCANQALCTVPTKHCVLCQPSAVYCANQALRTVPTKRHVLCQTNVVYCAKQAPFSSVFRAWRIACTRRSRRTECGTWTSFYARWQTSCKKGHSSSS